MKIYRVILLTGFILTVNVLRADVGFMEREGGIKSFSGTVTAVNSNGNKAEHCFTAVNEAGIVKVFEISTLEHLDVNDRVELKYEDSSTYPLAVRTVRFIAPEK